MMRTSFMLLLACQVCACRGAGEPAPPAPAPAPAPAVSETPRPTAPESVRRLPEKQDDCSSMHRLLVKCSGNRRLRSDGHFKRVFIGNCRREAARETAWAARFAACAASRVCETLDRCSRDLAEAAAELGPEHVRAVLAEGRREEAKKFCYDNGEAVKASEALHDLCHPLLEEAEADKAAADDHGSCPFH